MLKMSVFTRSHKGTSKNRSERRQFGTRSAAVRRYGEHRSAEIAPRSRFCEDPLIAELGFGSLDAIVFG